jgi:hypothetical protein
MSVACIGPIIIWIVFIIILYSILKEKWKHDIGGDRKIITVIVVVIIISSILIIYFAYVLTAPESHYEGMKATLLYNNENHTTVEEIKEILVENFSKVGERDFGFIFSFPHMSNSSLAHLYNRNVTVIIKFNEKVQNVDNNDIKIELELYGRERNPKEDKKEIIYDVEFIKNLLYNKLGIPYSVKYEKIMEITLI